MQKVSDMTFFDSISICLQLLASLPHNHLLPTCVTSGLGVFYAIWPGNGSSLFYSFRDLHKDTINNCCPSAQVSDRNLVFKGLTLRYNVKISHYNMHVSGG